MTAAETLSKNDKEKNFVLLHESHNSLQFIELRLAELLKIAAKAKSIGADLRADILLGEVKIHFDAYAKSEVYSQQFRDETNAIRRTLANDDLSPLPEDTKLRTLLRDGLTDEKLKAWFR
jgi:hypothetical protein